MVIWPTDRPTDPSNDRPLLSEYLFSLPFFRLPAVSYSAISVYTRWSSSGGDSARLLSSMGHQTTTKIRVGVRTHWTSSSSTTTTIVAIQISLSLSHSLLTGRACTTCETPTKTLISPFTAAAERRCILETSTAAASTDGRDDRIVNIDIRTAYIISGATQKATEYSLRLNAVAWRNGTLLFSLSASSSVKTVKDQLMCTDCTVQMCTLIVTMIIYAALQSNIALLDSWLHLKRIRSSLVTVFDWDNSVFLYSEFQKLDLIFIYGKPDKKLFSTIQ